MLEKIDVTASIDAVKTAFLDLQNHICKNIEALVQPATFHEDPWNHKEGGGGLTRIISGDVIEKGGVNFSHVRGSQLPDAAMAKRPELKDATFQAMGVSVVMHPRNPYVPTAHMNVRFIIIERSDADALWWFGGGFDLTPYYGFHEDCIHWHRMAKAACEPFGEKVYPSLKKWCDNYFYLKHRDEPRGIGGLFFDDLNIWGFDKSFEFVKSVGQHFVKAYVPIFTRRKETPYTQRERDFQSYRRGRYVEFNLLFDRGTLFGLQSGGRTESILMSLPPHVAWTYDYKPGPDTPESLLYTDFLKPKEWV